MAPLRILVALVVGGACFWLAALLLTFATPWGIVLRYELREYLTQRVNEVLGLDAEE